MKRMRRPSDGPASVKAERIRCAATAAPRVRARGPTDNLLRPGHDDPETRRTRTSSPFEGRRQSANVFAEARDRWAKPGEGASSDFHRELDAQRFRATQRRRRMSRYAPTRRDDPRSPWPSDAPLCHVSKGADDALTPRMQNRLYIGAPTRVGKRIPRGRSGGRRRPSHPSNFRAPLSLG